MDNRANAIWALLPDKYKFGEEKKYFMWLETKGSELRAYLAIRDCTSLTASDADEMPAFQELPEVDEAELKEAMTESIHNYA